MSNLTTDLETTDLWSLPDGLYPDQKSAEHAGLKLNLQVRGNARSWIVRHKGKWHGNGSLKDTPLQKARMKAGALVLRLDEGDDPIAERKAKQEAERAAKLAATTGKSFKEAGEEYLRANDTKWTNDKHKWQWSQNLGRAYAAFGDKDVAAVNRQDVLALLRSDEGQGPIWRAIPETARRLRGNVETVLDFADANGWRTEANPARFGPISMALGDQGEKAIVKPRPALPWASMPEFMADLRSRDTRAARALELTILCAFRGGEAVAAEWREIKHSADWSTGTWTVPKERVGRKGKKGERRPHIVPLSPAALEVLRKLHDEQRSGEAIFGLTTAALEKLVKTMNAGRTKAKLPRYVDPNENNRDGVPHGFRSSFRDWAGDVTNWDRETIEFALAHGITDKTEAA